MNVEPLTPEEKKWVKQMTKTLKSMPERLLMVECADGLFIVDREASRGVEMHDGGADRAGIVVHHFGAEGTFKVTSVSG